MCFTVCKLSISLFRLCIDLFSYIYIFFVFLQSKHQRARDDIIRSDVMAERVSYAGGDKGHFCQLNSLWSVWYGLLATVLNVYSVLLATRRLTGKTRIMK